jgi:membrane protein
MSVRSPIARAVDFVAGVIERLRDVGLAKTAAALSFTTLLGLVPLATVALVFVSQFPLFQQFLDALERFLLRYTLPGTGAGVRGYFVEFTAKAASLQGIGIAFVVITAITLIATIEAEINRIWGAPAPRSVVRRSFVYALGLTAGPMLIGGAVFAVTWVLEAAVDAVPAATYAVGMLAGPIGVGLTALALTLLYLLMPTRPVPWKAALAGGLFAAIAFEAAKRGFTLYITRFSTYQFVYGTLAALPVFLLWIYISWIVVMVGAAVTATLAEGRPRGKGRRRPS